MNRFVALVRVELARLSARRAVLLILLGAVVLPLLLAVSLVLGTDEPSDAEIAEAERLAASESGTRFIQRQVRQCVEQPASFGLSAEEQADPDTLRAACEAIHVPTADDFLYVDRLVLDEEREYSSGPAVVVILGALAFLAGTTFAGHDWATGSMSNQLLFEPRRMRVWGAKGLALVLAAAVVGLAVLTAYWLGLYGVVRARDQDVRAGALLDCLQHGWRGAAVVAASALGGFALTMLSRSTVFSLGLVFGVSVAGGLLLAVVGPDDPGPLDPTINAAAIIQDGSTYYVEPPARCFRGNDGGSGDPECASERTRSLAQGVTYYGVLLGVVGAASAGSFRRRDVP